MVTSSWRLRVCVTSSESVLLRNDRGDLGEAKKPCNTRAEGEDIVSSVNIGGVGRERVQGMLDIAHFPGFHWISRTWKEGADEIIRRPVSPPPTHSISAPHLQIIPLHMFEESGGDE